MFPGEGELLPKLLGVIEKEGSGIGEIDGVAIALEQGRAVELLECGNVAAECRLRDVQVCCGLAKIQVTCEDGEFS